MKHCPNCNIYFDDERQFCSVCGNPLSPHVQQNETPVAPPPPPAPPQVSKNTTASDGDKTLLFLPYLFAISGTIIFLSQFTKIEFFRRLLFFISENNYFLFIKIFALILSSVGLVIAIVTRKNRKHPIIAIVVSLIAILPPLFYTLVYIF